MSAWRLGLGWEALWGGVGKRVCTGGMRMHRRRVTAISTCIMAAAISATVAIPAGQDMGSDSSDGLTRLVQAPRAGAEDNEEARLPIQQLGRWEALPMGDIERVSGMVMEPGGTIWIMAKSAVYYWNGREFRPPPTLELKSGQYLTGLYGGADRGAYASQRGVEGHQGVLYKLSDGDAKPVADFYYDESGRRPGLYVSRSGKLYNWGKRFLAVYLDGEWQRVEAKLASAPYTLVFDTGEAVCFYYNGMLYCADADDHIAEHELTVPVETVPRQQIVRGALLGEDKMLLIHYGKRGVYIYDLNTREPVFVDEMNVAFPDADVHDLFRNRDGSVWVLGRPPEGRGYFFRRVSPEGNVTLIEATARLGWDNQRCYQYPESVLGASDGSVWFGMPGTIARYRDDQLRIFDWKDGLATGTACLLEDPDGNVCAGGRGVWVFHPGQPPGPLPPALRIWQEFEVASPHIMPDSEGGIWLALADRPGELSRWDGQTWHHLKMPFDTAKIGRTMADDRGHVLIQMGAYPDGCFDVAAEGVARYENVEAMLAAALADGARRFQTDSSYQGCFALQGGGLWYGFSNSGTVQYFDGERWDKFHMRDRVSYMYESAEHGILFRTQSDKYYTYDRGQIVEVEVGRPWDTSTLWLLGPKNFQPFEQALLKSRADLYMPVERDADGRYYLVDVGETTDASPNPTITRGDEIPKYLQTLTAGYFGGFWAVGSGVGPYRIFGRRAFELDFGASPAAGKSRSMRAIAEDRNHNLWINAGQYGGVNHVLFKELSEFRLKIGEAPAEVKRSLEIGVEPLLHGVDPGKVRLFWRLNGGPWQGGETGNAIAVVFASADDYQVEVMGIDRMGGTSQITELRLRATVPLPETRVAEEGPYAVKDVVWEAPVTLVPSEPGRVPKLAYRTDGGPWEVAAEGKRIPLGRLEPGPHTVEMAAQEEERYRDLPPIRLNVTYQPDYDFIVASRLDLIAGADSERAQTALAEIKMAGPNVIPILEERIAEARKAYRLLNALEELRRDIERQDGME